MQLAQRSSTSPILIDTDALGPLARQARNRPPQLNIPLSPHQKSYYPASASFKRVMDLSLPAPLQRGLACLTCRKRKLKCDATRPACSQCVRAVRECVYDDSPQRTRTQKLQDRVEELEDQLRSYQVKTSGSLSPIGPSTSSTSPSSSGLSSSPSSAFGSSEWWQQDNLASDVQKYLLNIFMTHRRKVYFEIQPDRFVASFSAAAGPFQPHPALRNAVWLVACHLSDNHSLMSKEEVFLSKARQGIQDSLAASDRLFHSIQASVLLCAYLYRKGRMLEAYHQTCSAAKFAVACGLHQLRLGTLNESDSKFRVTWTPWNSHTTQGRIAPGLLEAPQDMIELGERIYAWWCLYLLDKTGSITLGLPSALPNETSPPDAPTTAWPRLLEDYARTGFNEALEGSIQTLYNSSLPTNSGPPDSTFTLRLKAQALLERAHRISLGFGTSYQTTPEFRASFTSVDTAIFKFLQLNGSGRSQSDHVGVFIVNTVAQAAVVILHQNIADAEASSYEKCSNAANACVQLLDQIGLAGPIWSDMILGHCWTMVTNFLFRKLAWYRKSNRAVQAAETERGVGIIVAAMNRLLESFPSLDFQLKKIRDFQLISSAA